MRTLLAVTQFFWTATRGSRLAPWRSPYLRWRLETYTGIPAGQVTLADFWRLAIAERNQMRRFAGWLGEMKSVADERPR